MQQTGLMSGADPKKPFVRPRAILFDLDGTLADTAPDLAGAVNLLRTDRGMPPAPYEKLRPVASAGARGLIGVAFGLAPGQAEYELLRDQFLDCSKASPHCWRRWRKTASPGASSPTRSAA